MSIGDKIKELRKLRNINENEMAEKLLVSKKVLNSWENNKIIPSKDKLWQISELLGVDYKYFFDEEKIAKIDNEFENIEKKHKIIKYCVCGLVIILALYILLRIFLINTPKGRYKLDCYLNGKNYYYSADYSYLNNSMNEYVDSSNDDIYLHLNYENIDKFINSINDYYLSRQGGCNINHILLK